MPLKMIIIIIHEVQRLVTAPGDAVSCLAFIFFCIFYVDF